MISWDDIRAIALSLPGVEESTTNGDPAFRVNGRLFLHLGRGEGGTLNIRVGWDTKQPLLAARPDRFFVLPAHRRGPVVTTRLDANGKDDLEELAELIEEAWHRYAPPALVAQRDASRGDLSLQPNVRSDSPPLHDGVDA